ncbi:phage tail assembly chaperone [Hyphococcus sp.]|uniref:phage tail assembly chaperone n=1 Tax=Hyphococcus sp. TaxID=2038636 RepID=UPI003CCC226A
MLSFAVLRLGLSPQDFWALGAAEWPALVPASATQGLNRAGLNALIAQHKEKSDA